MDNINLILKKRLCSGCGACTAICSKNCIIMKSRSSYNYPCIDSKLCNKCGLCLKVCPGNRILDRLNSKRLSALHIEDTLANYVACSTDEKIRYNAASGGVISSLLIFLLKEKYIDGAICVKQDEGNPLSNKTFIAETESDVLNASGSRYSPVSNCEVLKDILEENKKYAFIGKPCEIEAINEMEKHLPKLKAKIIVKISIMCACTPSRKGTLRLLKNLNIEASEITKLSYRGNGWPGMFCAETKDGSKKSIPYLDAWNKCLSKYSCLRCTVCDDPLGSGADITVGDAWDKKLIENNAGLSAVIVRTKTGKDYFDKAIAANGLTVNEISADDILRFQKSLVSKHGKGISNVFAYNLVFLHQFSIRELLREYGLNPRVYYSLLKRVFRFFVYRKMEGG